MANPFSGPIPGQSLTSAPGASPWEHPPQFTDANDALEFLFDKLTMPRQATRIIASLESGVTCEYLARALVFNGFASGKWTPDVAGLMIRTVLYMIVAMGARAGVKDMIIMNPDREQEELLDGFLDTIPKRQAKLKQPSKEQVNAAIDVVKETEQAVTGEAPAENKLELKGIMGGLGK